MTTKIAITQIDTGSNANLVISSLPVGVAFTAGDNISIAANGKISSTATSTTAVSDSYHPFLTIGA